MSRSFLVAPFTNDAWRNKSITTRRCFPLSFPMTHAFTTPLTDVLNEAGLTCGTPRLEVTPPTDLPRISRSPDSIWFMNTPARSSSAVVHRCLSFTTLATQNGYNIKHYCKYMLNVWPIPQSTNGLDENIHPCAFTTSGTPSASTDGQPSISPSLSP